MPKRHQSTDQPAAIRIRLPPTCSCHKRDFPTFGLFHPAKVRLPKIPTRCDGQSKSEFNFQDDIALADKTEDWLVNHFVKLGFDTTKTPAQEHGLPDIEPIHKKIAGAYRSQSPGAHFHERAHKMPAADLSPFETVVFNLSDLERYISLQKNEWKPIYIVWAVKHPCIGLGFWGQELAAHEQIMLRYGGKRRYRRGSTPSVVVAGAHKGVTVNYHFSAQELLPLFDLDRALLTLI